MSGKLLFWKISTKIRFVGKFPQKYALLDNFHKKFQCWIITKKLASPVSHPRPHTEEFLFSHWDRIFYKKNIGTILKKISSNSSVLSYYFFYFFLLYFIQFIFCKKCYYFLLSFLLIDSVKYDISLSLCNFVTLLLCNFVTL